MKNTWILSTAALAVGAVGGFISGKNTGTSESASSEQAEIRTRAGARTTSEVAGEGNRRSRATSVEEIYRSPGSSSRVQALMDLYGSLSPEQLQEEAEKLANLPMSERMMASFLLFSRWAEVDPMAAMAHANTMGFEGAFVRPTILQSWASVDPANAAKYYSENPGQFAMMGGRGPMGGQNASAIIAGEWAKQDPEAALAWANTLQQGKGDALTSIITEVSKTDPSKAIGLLASLSPEERANAYGPLARQYGAKNFDEAKSWISSLPTDQQEAAFAEAIRGLSASDPQKALAEISSMPAGSAKDRLIPNLVGTLAKIDPQAAAQLIASQESERAQGASMRELMRNWATQNPAEALAYARSQPAGRLQDSAISDYVVSNITGNPAELVQVAQSISDNRQRTIALSAATRRWLQTDNAAATAAIQAMDIPDRMKERLTNGEPVWGGGPQGGGQGRGQGRGGRGQGGGGGNR